MINRRIRLNFLLCQLFFSSFAVYGIDAYQTTESINIDGYAQEKVWSNLRWHSIAQPIIGALPSKSDFSGRYKVAWNQQQIYLLVEIVDDVLFDGHPQPLQAYWDDDCLEIFIDEDASGGNHQFNFNAFAYHIALDNQVVDLGLESEGTSSSAILLNEHIRNRWQRHPSESEKIIWELAISVFDDKFKPGQKNTPVKLSNNKQLGFMIAYCDNDGSRHRENFIGSIDIQAVNGDKNRGYIDADVFDKLILKK